MEKFLAAGITCLVALVLWTLIGAAVAWGIEWAWNSLVPSLFHGPSITFAQACIGYFLLSLVGGTFRSVAPSSSAKP